MLFFLFFSGAVVAMRMSSSMSGPAHSTRQSGHRAAPLKNKNGRHRV
jgi:hypothetical protein